MRHPALIICVGAAVLAGGCATKRYPIAPSLGMAEAELLDCNDLALEIIRAEQVQAQIRGTAQTDWRSVAGFLGDFGIGNAMARSEADAAVEKRLRALNAWQVKKECVTEDAGSEF